MFARQHDMLPSSDRLKIRFQVEEVLGQALHTKMAAGPCRHQFLGAQGRWRWQRPDARFLLGQQRPEMQKPSPRRPGQNQDVG
jgi:hypothetical protein